MLSARATTARRPATRGPRGSAIREAPRRRNCCWPQHSALSLSGWAWRARARRGGRWATAPRRPGGGGGGGGGRGGRGGPRLMLKAPVPHGWLAVWVEALDRLRRPPLDVLFNEDIGTTGFDGEEAAFEELQRALGLLASGSAPTVVGAVLRWQRDGLLAEGGALTVADLAELASRLEQAGALEWFQRQVRPVRLARVPGQ